MKCFEPLDLTGQFFLNRIECWLFSAVWCVLKRHHSVLYQLSSLSFTLWFCIHAFGVTLPKINFGQFGCGPIGLLCLACGKQRLTYHHSIQPWNQTRKIESLICKKHP
ncbi:hypothetical protein P8452_73064 [Trifolium repens]|nr:hypothetical protein P8452_73064 [Trifolium repens]